MEISNGFNYFDAMAKAKKQYARLLEPICRQHGLTRNELDVMLFLHNNPQFDRAADIVSRRGIAKSHVSLSVTDLEARGLLVRSFDPSDRRTAHLLLTETGKNIAAQAREEQQRYFSEMYRGITEEEFDLWHTLTQKVCENIEKLEQGDQFD